MLAQLERLSQGWVTEMLVFLKLGGSLITDKSAEEKARVEAINDIAAQVLAAQHAQPSLRILLGHGSGSFGHVAAHKYGTRNGVYSTSDWRGFTEVARSAERLNRIVMDRFADAGIPVVCFRPSSSVMCEAGKVHTYELSPIRSALEHNLVPLVYGDVAFDIKQGGTIVSTEDVFVPLAKALEPKKILLAGEVSGVLDSEGQVVPFMIPGDITRLGQTLGGSAHIDVTGGMKTKVDQMLTLCQEITGLSVHIFSGLEPGSIFEALVATERSFGTMLSADQV
jgi:isopentenyl phosphate kinase